MWLPRIFVTSRTKTEIATIENFAIILKLTLPWDPHHSSATSLEVLAMCSIIGEGIHTLKRRFPKRFISSLP
jgi:hypothetical protein